MSSVEARVHLDLERRQVPFSWRYFDGESVHLTTLIPGFAPEFTLREYKIVILVVGNFWGTLPGILDVNALAQAALEADGWKVVTLFENEVVENVARALDSKAPELVAPAFRGKPRPNPYGNVDLMKTRRENLRGQGLRRRKFETKGTERDATRRKPRRRSGGDGNRLRRRRTQ